MKTKKPDLVHKIVNDAYNYGVAKTDLDKRIRRAIRAAEKRGALAERERIERYIKERRASSPNGVVRVTCADILTDIDHGARPARKARKGGAK